MEPNGSPSPSPPPPYVVAEAVRVPPTPPRRGGWFGKLLIVLLLIVLGGSLLVNLFVVGSGDSDRRVRERFFSHQRTGQQKVVILSIKGIIMGSDDSFVKRQIEQASKDKSVKAVVLRVDSPGGTVSGSDYYFHHLRRLAEQRELPIVVSMGGEAASGGYYVSMAVGSTPDTIFAEPTTFTGSIGVIIPHYNLGGLMKKLGIEEDPVATGKLKDMGSFARAMTPEEQKIFRALIDDSFERFKEVIKEGRPRFKKDPAALEALATGQVYSAEQARRLGMVDRVGYLEDAVDRAIELAGLDSDDVRVVKYEPEFSLFGSLLSLEARKPGLDLAGMLELASPRAYYLSTQLPLWMSSNHIDLAP